MMERWEGTPSEAVRDLQLHTHTRTHAHTFTRYVTPLSKCRGHSLVCLSDGFSHLINSHSCVCVSQQLPSPVQHHHYLSYCPSLKHHSLSLSLSLTHTHTHTHTHTYTLKLLKYSHTERDHGNCSAI